jgi:hypothetical protein
MQTASYVSSRLGVGIKVEEGFGEWMYIGDFSEDPFD